MVVRGQCVTSSMISRYSSSETPAAVALIGTLASWRAKGSRSARRPSSFAVSHTGPRRRTCRRSRTSPATSGASRPPGAIAVRVRALPRRSSSNATQPPANCRRYAPSPSPVRRADVRRGRQGHSCRETRSDSWGRRCDPPWTARIPRIVRWPPAAARHYARRRTTSGTGAVTGPVRRPRVDRLSGSHSLDRRGGTACLAKIGFTGDRDHHQRQRCACRGA